MHIASYYEKLENDKVHCFLCPHHCRIKPEGIGICGARKNIGGELFSLNYGKIASAALDPIEKKPLRRFHPGTQIFSVGSFGCNLKCSFCQNWNIAHQEAKTVEADPHLVVEKAKELKSMGNIGIAYTYNEPSIWYEFVLDTCREAKKEGLANVLVTNGFIEKEPLEEMLPFVDAMNIDVKAYTEKFYNEICKGSLEMVKKTLKTAAGRCHVEVTTLIIPGLNDSIGEIEKLSDWIAGISPDIPLHLTRFFPNYKMLDKSPTQEDTLRKAAEKARESLKYVYIGNM